MVSRTVWLSLVERYLRDVEAGGSNPLTPTIHYISLQQKASVPNLERTLVLTTQIAITLANCKKLS